MVVTNEKLLTNEETQAQTGLLVDRVERDMADVLNEHGSTRLGGQGRGQGLQLRLRGPHGRRALLLLHGGPAVTHGANSPKLNTGATHWSPLVVSTFRDGVPTSVPFSWSPLYPRLRISSSMWARMPIKAAAPSPTAAATCLVLLARASPAAKTP